MRERLLEYPVSPESGLQIWTAALDAIPTVERRDLESVLDDVEHERAARFHFDRDREHYVAARGYLRQLIGAALQIPARAVRFSYGAHGKPETSDVSDGRVLCFNLSHSAGWAMFALAWDCAVGIDLESTTRLAADDEHLSALAARVLSDREFIVWRELPDAAARRDAFLRAWTRKEAFVKATGEGVFDGLREIEMILDAATPRKFLAISSACADRPSNWMVHDLNAPDGFVAAVALARP